MGLYEVPLSLLGFGIGTMLANFNMYLMMLLFRAVLNNNRTNPPGQPPCEIPPGHIPTIQKNI